FIIPACSAGSIITYSIWANDTSNNTDTAGPYQYIISALYRYDFGNILGSYTYNVTTANPIFNLDVTAGDMFYYSVTNILRDFDFGGGHFVDFANGSWSYYNSTDNSTSTETEAVISAYNRTHSFDSPLGIHHYVSEITDIMMDFGILNFNFLPLDFFAANETIVNITYMTMLMMDPASEFHYSFTHDLSTNNIAGTWTMWNGTAGNDGTETGTLLLSLTFNREGILTSERLYVNGTTDWNLVLELMLIEEAEEGEEAPLGLLLAAIAGGGEGIGMTAILIIALIVGIGVIVLIIAVTKARR
ncbi:MAG: hypothetical protein ACFFCM_16320, partial [Promethearchaeota archaeon]